MTVKTKKAKGSMLCLAVALSALSAGPGLAEEPPDWIKNTKLSGSFFGGAADPDSDLIARVTLFVQF